MCAFKLLTLMAAAGTVFAESRGLFSGTFAGSTIFALQFDDTTESLSVVKNVSIRTDDGSKWIALDERGKNLYVATTGAYQSYAITAEYGLDYQSNITLSSNCSNANFLSATAHSPYTVFGAAYSAGCPALVMSVTEVGTLRESFASLTYDNAAGVHGLAVSPTGDFVYSADDMGNAVWAHSFDARTGAVEKIQKITTPKGANPRHLAVHPNGAWVYVVYEELNTIAVYTRDAQTGLLTDTDTTYPLLPAGLSNSTSSFWADEVLFSIPTAEKATSPKYLVAATRSREKTATGYVSAFALDPATGAIQEQLFLLPTTASGGSANAVAPAPFSEEYFAITDSGSNFVEVWKIDGKNATAVGHADVPGPANVVWYEDMKV